MARTLVYLGFGCMVSSVGGGCGAGLRVPGEDPSSIDGDGDGWTPLEGDCDDQDPRVFPGQLDEAGDGLDADCDGTDGGPLLELEGVIRLDADRSIRQFGSSVDHCAPGGRATGRVMVGAPGGDEPVSHGRVELFGTPLGLDRGRAMPVATVNGDGAQDQLGAGLAWVGDVNGDGFDDAVAGAHGTVEPQPQTGAAYVFYGPLSGEMEAGGADAVLRGVLHAEFAGYVVAGVGDLDADGRDDFVVGAPLQSNSEPRPGRVYVILGAPTGEQDLSDVGVVLEGGAVNGRLGLAIARAPDWDGDGFAGLVLGAPLSSVGGLQGAGQVLVVDGPFDSDRDLGASGVAAEIVGGEERSGFGRSLAVTDLDGDGVKDLAIGAYLSRDRTGGVYVFKGPLSGVLTTSDAAVSILPGPSDGWLGARLVGLDDRDGDGYGELLVASPGDYYSPSGPERVYRFDGPLSGEVTTASASGFVEAPPGLYFGGSLSAGCDATGDGLEDLVIGAPSATYAGPDSGSVFVVALEHLLGG